MELIILAVVFVALVPIVLFFILKLMFREHKISNSIRNQDTFSQEYLFRVNYAKDEFLRKINIPNVYDVLEFTFDHHTMTITFSQHNTKVPYTVFVKEFDGGCYIKLTKNTWIGARSMIPYQINEFMIKKFDAELLPYEEYLNIVV